MKLVLLVLEGMRGSLETRALTDLQDSLGRMVTLVPRVLLGQLELPVCLALARGLKERKAVQETWARLETKDKEEHLDLLEQWVVLEGQAELVNKDLTDLSVLLVQTDHLASKGLTDKMASLVPMDPLVRTDSTAARVQGDKWVQEVRRESKVLMDPQDLRGP